MKLNLYVHLTKKILAMLGVCAKSQVRMSYDQEIFRINKKKTIKIT